MLLFDSRQNLAKEIQGIEGEVPFKAEPAVNP